MSNMLSYLAASLPQQLSTEARALALLCVLRSSPSGLVDLPRGLTRGLALPHPQDHWEELAAADWLHPAAPTTAWLLDPLLGLPGRRHRARAADWFLRSFRSREVRHLDATARMVMVALASHTPPGSAAAVADRSQLALRSGVLPSSLMSFLRLLTENLALGTWSYDVETGDLAWTLGSF
ncbi:hypothetical protein ACI2LO_30865 [Streptomyces sp. NPDC033754]|uniref:hypothetical protein n=1 Tax=unclassified Streptomyces TaxID=2593676 RepID=UPI0033C47305